MANCVTYELPLNERTRLFLRLEYLFCQSAQALEENKYWTFQMSLNALCEILNLLNRIDIKSETLQELDRMRKSLVALQNSVEVDEIAIDKVLKSLTLQHDCLFHFSLSELPNITKNEFLSQLRQRLNGPGSALSYDFPAFHHWLHCSDQHKMAQLRAWLDDLAPLSAAIWTMLNLVRTSGKRLACLAHDGRFQQQFEKGHQLKLIRLHIEQSLSAYPEMTGNKHRMNVRFLQTSPDNPRPEPIYNDVPFELSFCQI